MHVQTVVGFVDDQILYPAADHLTVDQKNGFSQLFDLAVYSIGRFVHRFGIPLFVPLLPVLERNLICLLEKQGEELGELSYSFEAGIGFSGGLLYNNCEKKKAKRQEIG